MIKEVIARILGNTALSLGYDAGDSVRTRKDLGWGRATPRDEDSLVQDNTRNTMRQKAADLRRNNAVVAGVCDRLALFSVGAGGIVPQCRTRSNEWNRIAEDFWMNEFAPTCDSRGRSSLLDFQNMAVSLRPTHGGMYFQKLEDGTIRPIECERIRDPQKPPNPSPYVEGVKVDKAGGTIRGYLVHSRDNDGGFTSQHAEQYVEAENIIPVIRPPWRPDMVREIPDFAPIIPTLQDIHEMNKYMLNSTKWQSMVLGFLKKQGGNGLNSLQRGSTNPTAGSRQTFRFDWGEILEGFPGDDLDMKAPATPNATHIPYVKLQLALCSSALSMPYEFFTLDLSGLDFSRQKGMLLLVNFACRPWKKWLIDRFLQPLWSWRMAMAMDGEIPPAPVDANGISEWNKVEWQPPEEVWIDRQEAMQADMMEIQSGLGTLTRAAKRRGLDIEDLVRERAREEKMIDGVATETGVNRDRLSKMQIPGQTGAIEKPAQEQPEPPAKKPEVEDAK
jgi:lambda family phage portal protein